MTKILFGIILIGRKSKKKKTLTKLFSQIIILFQSKLRIQPHLKLLKRANRLLRDVNLTLLFKKQSFEYFINVKIMVLVLNKIKKRHALRTFFCGPTWARTRDHLIMSQVL